DEERLRVEKERMELEAEQKHLEEERASVEKRKMELEAEKKKTAQLLAAKRLEEERQKTAKLGADKAAAEKLRVERSAAEEKARIVRLAKESQKPVITAQPEVEKMQMDLAHDDLLDLPFIEKSAEPNISTDVLALEVEHPVASYTRPEASFDLYSSEAGHQSFISRPPVMVAMAAVLLFAVGGVWMFMGSGRSATPTASPVTAVQTEPPATEDKPQAGQSVETQSADSNSTFALHTESQVADSSPQVESKVEPDAKQKPKKQPTPQAKPSPEKTKKVTVDDLINDN
ncbi:MAG: hypothetical protein ACRD43_02620, partial [Pyrinomonadaceae bacterium]